MMACRTRSTRPSVFALALALAMASTAQAQTTGGAATPPEASANAAADPASPADIIVTATKRAENVQTVPISITAVSSELLARQGVNGLGGLDLLVPGFKFGQSGNDARPAIRGTRTQQVIGNADPLVAFYSDGIYRSRPGQAVLPIFDVDRVEVARGPQGTLFGRNSFGGAINVISRAPRLDSTDAGIALEYGNFNQVRAEGFANIGGAGVALRLSAYSAYSDGWVENRGLPGNNLHDDVNTVVRGALRFESGGLSNVTRVEYWKGEGAGPGDFGYFTPGVPINPATRQTNGVNGVIDPVIAVVPGRGGGYGGLPAGTRGDSDYRVIARGYPFARNVRQLTAANETNLDLGVADARLILSYTNYSEYRQGDPDYSTFKQDAAFNQVTAKTYSQELQLVSKPEQAFSWVVGAFLLQDTPTDLYTFGTDNSGQPGTVNGISLDPARNTPFNLYVQGPFTSKTNSVAVYGDGTLSLTDNLRVLGGVRWTRDKRTATIQNVPFAGYAPFNTEGPTRRTFEKVTWRAGAQIDLAPRSMLYGTYSTGFLAGGFSGAPSFSLTTSSLTTFDPQTATAIEIGSKNTLFDGKLRLNLVAYRNVYNNLVTQRLVQVGNAISTTTANAGKIKSWGAELEGDYYPSDGAYLGLRLAYTNARFGDYVVGNNFTEGANIAGVNSFQLNGLQVPLNPDFTATGIVSYEFDTGSAGTFTPSATVFYSSSYRTSDQPYFFANQGAYATVDASLRWKPAADSALAIAVFGKNLTDRRILLRTTPNAGSVIYQDFANPRTYGVRLTFNY